MRGAEDLGGDVCPGPHAPGPGARKGGPGWCPPSGVPAFLLDLARDQQRLVGGIAQAVLWPIGNPGANGKVERLDIRPDQLDQPQTVLGRRIPVPTDTIRSTPWGPTIIPARMPPSWPC